MPASHTLLIQHAAQVLTLAGGALGRPLAGPDLSNWHITEHGYVACVGDKIVALGSMSELNRADIGPKLT